MNRETILRSMAGTVWALDRRRFEELLAMAELMAATDRRRPTLEPQRAGRGNAVGVVPIRNVISRRSNLFTELFGGSSVDDISSTVREFAEDDRVGRIILDIDSPGGSVDGMTELAALLRQVRKHKPITAVANSTAASAAYWIGSQASELMVTPSGWVGSIGVFVVHEDISRALDKIGITPTLIVSEASPHKAEDSPFEPLSEAARDENQRLVDAHASTFVYDVAVGRGVTPSTVRADYGKGRMLLARDAVAAGMADGVGTIESAVVAPGPRATAQISASLEVYQRRAAAHARGIGA